MKSRVIWATVCFFMLISMVFVSCAKTTISPVLNTTSQQTTASSPTKTSTNANWWDSMGTPEYGGMLTIPEQSNSQTTFDPAEFGGGSGLNWESLFYRDWTVDRNVESFVTEFVDPQYYKDGLAASWEQTDPTTITVHLVQGVFWQNKAPLNGRELTAADVQYTYDRILGTGNGFNQPNPFYAGSISNIKQVVAKDKYDVQFILKTAAAIGIYDVFDGGAFPIAIVAPEWVALGESATSTESSTTSNAAPDNGSSGGMAPPPGFPPLGGPVSNSPLNDWKNATGTGPWILSDFSSGVSTTYTRNANYWGFDERYPKNKLPYMDEIKKLVIPDTSTTLAALRTGKIDIYETMNQATWQDAQSLAKSKPEIVQGWWPSPGQTIEMRVDKSPFTDINVRTALQMSLDLKTIAKSYYGGIVTGVPEGLINSKFTGWTLPYDQWSADLQAEYAFNPTKAKELLAKAGYPDGFKTDVIAQPGGEDIQLLQLIKSQFMDIGVDMEINMFSDMASKQNYAQAGKMDQMTYTNTAGHTRNPLSSIKFRTSLVKENYTFNSDSQYDALVEKAEVAASIADAKQYCSDAEMYSLSKHWAITTFSTRSPIFWQAWVKGNSGENSTICSNFYYARWWIDETLK